MQETNTKYKGNQTNLKPKPEIQNQTNARPTPHPESTNKTKTSDYDNYKPPDTNKTSKPESEPEPKPNLTKNKPPKLKTKVVHVGDIKLFLAAKQKERELKMKCFRENDESILLNKPSDRSIEVPINQVLTYFQNLSSI